MSVKTEIQATDTTINHFFIIHAAKTCCIAFVFYGETFVYQNCGENVLWSSESVFICTSADKRVSAVIYIIPFTRNFSLNQK